MPIEWPNDDGAGARDSGRSRERGAEPHGGDTAPQPLGQLGHEANASVPLLNTPSHPQHGLYAMNYDLLGAAAFAQDPARQRAAASLTAMEVKAEMPRVDHIVHNGRGDIIAIAGALTDPAHKRVAGKLEDLCAIGIERSSLEAMSGPSKTVPPNLPATRDLPAQHTGAENPPAPIRANPQNEPEGPAKPRAL